MLKLLNVGVWFLLLGCPASAVTFSWATVGDPGNACELQFSGCFGAVADEYQVSKFEVTNAQYAEFLNAAAADDPGELYYYLMGSGYGGIARAGEAGGYTYSVIAGREDVPVNMFPSTTPFGL